MNGTGVAYGAGAGTRTWVAAGTGAGTEERVAKAVTPTVACEGTESFHDVISLSISSQNAVQMCSKNVNV